MNAQNHISGSFRHKRRESRSPRHHRPKHRRRRSSANRSTSPGPLRRRPHASGDAPRADRLLGGGNKSPFHSGLRDILHGIFGQGEQGPTSEELVKLADDFGDLIVNELVDRLVVELKDGLLEKLLIQYLEDLVTGAVKKKLSGLGGNKEKETKGRKNDKGWKKGLLKKAAMTLIQGFTR